MRASHFSGSALFQEKSKLVKALDDNGFGLRAANQSIHGRESGRGELMK